MFMTGVFCTVCGAQVYFISILMTQGTRKQTTEPILGTLSEQTSYNRHCSEPRLPVVRTVTV